eukprot:SAG31_NODE_104_length_25069_cov_12.917144_2_plen_285_part_00
MTAQIERTHRGLDECCRPVLNDLDAMNWARTTMIQHIVARLEVSHPTAAQEMLSLVNGAVTQLNPDGTVTSTSSGKLRWTQAALDAELTRCMTEYTFAAPTAVACIINLHDWFATASQPFCFEMPTAILEIIGAEPMGEIAEMYRGYVRHTLMPLLRRVVDTLREHAAYVEFPSKEWLQGQFPDMSWRTYNNRTFLGLWYAYSLSFERVLLEWSNGNFSWIRPTIAQPSGGIARLLIQSQAHAEARQAELIGMTSVAELDYGSVLTRFSNDQAHSRARKESQAS